MAEPLSILIEVASGIAGVSAAWAVMRTKLAAIETAVGEHGGRLDTITERLHQRELKERDADARLTALEKADSQRAAAFDDFRVAVVTRELFQVETKAQNRRLDDIISRLSRQTPSAGMQRVERRDDRREDNDSDPPLPPMRAKVPTLR